MNWPSFFMGFIVCALIITALSSVYLKGYHDCEEEEKQP